MRIRKIRGQKRIWKVIENWKNANLYLDLDELKIRGRNYVKISVHPFSSIPLTNSNIPQPKKETKKRILNGLIDIYDAWKSQLKTLNEPYYLKIWLYNPRVSKSQVVCAIGSFIDFYDTTFQKPAKIKKINSDNYGALKNRIDLYNWEYRLDEEFLNNTEVGNLEDYETKEEYLKNKKWFESKLQKPHRKIVFDEPIGNITESYAFKHGEIWFGEKS